MALASGTKLGPYEIAAQIGAGGMGEVYQAHDTKLGRDVAIKVLPEAFAHDADRLSRFQREAKMLASLNHPNIATIHGLEQSGGTSYLVMELVSGETLSERVKRDGAVPIEETLAIAKQIAEALEAAHEKGIIHRDLKPANVKLTPEGKVKVLDFGLAKAFEADSAAEDMSNSPTLSRAATLQGVILGTAAYMSPEQARGKSVDKRTDIWAFGCVLYELLTGKQAFDGEDITEILAAVVKIEPDWTRLPEATPTTIGVLLRRCLRKDRRQRLQDAAGIRIEIEETLAAPHVAPSVAATKGWRQLLPWAGALVLSAVIGLAVWNLKPSTWAGSRPVARLTAVLSPGEELVVSMFPAIALSRDGTQLAYVARRAGVQQLYLRPFESLEGKPISGAEGALSPFFSPDGHWVGFFAEGKLKKVPVTGGTPITICDAPGAWGGSWGQNDVIYFARGSFSALWQVTAKGETPRPFTKLDGQTGEVSHRWPQVLPGGKAVLFSVWTGPGRDERQIQLQMVGSGERRLLVQGGSSGYYVPTGHLVYSRQGTLMAVPFDLARLEVAESAPIDVTEGVLDTEEGTQYAVSSNGPLAYVPGSPQQYESTLVWVDRNGKSEPLSAPPRFYFAPRLSPDGQEVALWTFGATADVWIYDLVRGTVTRLISQGSSQFPIWTPDGKRLTYRGTRGGSRNLFWKMADGSGAEERLTTGEGTQTVGSWSPDGQVLAFTAGGSTTGSDIWILRLSDRKTQPFLQTPSNESAPRFSPDGRWLAYISDESGRVEVYVQPYPGPGGKWQISTEGGTGPVWNRNGRELFYRSGDKMMAVEIATQPGFAAGKPRVLFEGQYQPAPGNYSNYDVSPDGQRFLMLKPMEQAERAPTQINVVLNWFEELKQKVPTVKK
jgi:serine/threonine protein kinase/Tol biopolymer transport system component